jgi:hypothetical protein
VRLDSSNDPIYCNSDWENTIPPISNDLNDGISNKLFKKSKFEARSIENSCF